MDNVIPVAFPDHFRSQVKPIPELPTEEEMKAELRGESKPRKKLIRESCAGLNWYPRLKLWKSSKVSFDPETQIALSYDWWQFVRPINGQLVFNSYRYSNTTTKHQWCVRFFLKEQGIKIDLEIESPDGLQRLDSAIGHYERQIRKLREKIAVKGSRKAKNAERIGEIEHLQKMILTVHGLISAQEVANG